MHVHVHVGIGTGAGCILHIEEKYKSKVVGYVPVSFVLLTLLLLIIYQLAAYYLNIPSSSVSSLIGNFVT